MVVISCPAPGFEYVNVDESVVAALLNLHALAHTPATTRTTSPKLDRPHIDMGVDQGLT